MSPPFLTRVRIVATALAVALVAACTGLSDLQLSGACNINSDCTAPLVCAFQICHQQCDTSRDCPAPDICVSARGSQVDVDGASVAYNFCESVACTTSAACPTGQTCAADGQCRDACSVGVASCIAGQACVEGVCVDTTDLTDGGKLKGAPDASALGSACVLSSDCGDAGLVCRSGACDVQCRADIDCLPPDGPGGVCRDQICVAAASSTDAGHDAGHDASARDAGRHDAGHDAASDALPPGFGDPCNLPSDCPSGLRCGAGGRCTYACVLSEDCPNSGLGYCCVAHQCYPGVCPADAGADAGAPDASPDAACKACTSNDECQDGNWCDGVERCVALCCAPALTTPCDSNSACVVDTCDEATETCTHTPVAGMDVDGDGHLAFGCVGGDDCDDDDPTIYTGHPEVFDGKDNDCNGLVDDHVAEPKGASPTLGYPDGGIAVAPFAVPLGGPTGDPVNGAWGVVAFDQTANVDQYQRQRFTMGWTPEAAASVVGHAIAAYPFAALGAASGPDTSAFLIYLVSDELDLVVLNDDLSLAGVAALNAPGGPGVTPGDVTWTGSSYLVAWAAGGEGYFAEVDTSGTMMGTQAIPTAMGEMYTNSGAITAASNGTSLAVAYTGPESTGYGVFLTVLSEAGEVNGTVECAPGTTNFSGDVAYAVAGVPDGFVVLWSENDDTYATYVPALGGVPDASKLVQLTADPDGHGYTSGHGAFDGVGAAFLVSSGTDVAFGYLNGVEKTDAGAPANPFEMAVIGPGAVEALDLAGPPGGRLAAAYLNQDRTSIGVAQVGYCSLSGSACSVGTNCCSGTCTAVVTTGPGAYSTCE
jgi:hypothetical protein